VIFVATPQWHCCDVLSMPNGGTVGLPGTCRVEGGLSLKVFCWHAWACRIKVNRSSYLLLGVS
jgi:hypothetical protein